MAAARQDAYCTLLISDAYLPGAMVLAHSLRDNGTEKQLAVLITLDSLQASTIEELKKSYDHIIPVDPIVNKSPANLYLMDRPDLASTFTKIALWRQTQFSHIVYVDADVVALRAVDELFDNPTKFAAVPDIGWPDCFNSGVLSLNPNMGDYYALLALAQRGVSFDGADQGLLNMHFRNWERLSFTYNCTPSGSYQYVPAYRHFQSSINMVHFIGNEKPWIVGRDHKTSGGVYEELLGRWWAVYDKHYRSTSSAHPDSPAVKLSRTVQQYVKGEAPSTQYGIFSVGTKVDELGEPEVPVHTTEPLLTDKTDPAEELQKGKAVPISKSQQRRFSVDWDPIHQAPPINSRPEAANFPHDIYNMSADTKLFQAPKYPDAPKDMYYQVPSTPPISDRPKPIFPWESNAPKATRVFAEDIPSEAAPSVTTDDSAITDGESPRTPTTEPSATNPLATYQHANAWDEMPEIERYISNLPQNRRAKIQVLMNNTAAQLGGQETSAEAINSPISEGPPARRPSMKLTDFPTEIERPSLPVTPAPVRRPSFWGDERNAQGELPGAEGVPSQTEWNPIARLEDLQRRQSEVLAQGPISPGLKIPDRDLPGSASIPIPEAKEEDTHQMPSRATTSGQPSFQPVDLSGGSPLNFAGSASSEDERKDTIGPTET